MRLPAPRIAPLTDAEFTDEQKEILAPMGGRVLNMNAWPCCCAATCW